MNSRDKNKLAKQQESKPDALIVRSQSSFELTRNKDGTVSYKSKVYHDNPVIAAQLAMEVDRIVGKAYKIETGLKKLKLKMK